MAGSFNRPSQPPTASPSVRMLRFLDNTRVRDGRRTRIYFGGCNYLGLAWHPALRRALAKAGETGPFQTGASRRTTGEHPDFLRTEQSLAHFFQAESAAFFASGYLASMSAVESLRTLRSHVLLDAGSHRCLRDGARLSGLPVLEFASWDADALKTALRSLPAGSLPLVVTDGTGAVRPGIAPLDAYLDLLPRKGLMLVDDAHGAGTVGPGGRGATALLGIHDPRVLLSVTLAKAFAVAGGAVLGAKWWVDPIRGNAGAYTGSTAQPLGLLAAARAALHLVDRAPGRVRRFQSNQALFAGLTAGIRGLSSDPRSPVTIALPANPSQGASLKAALEAAGIHAPWIQYPGGPDSGFFRFAVSAAHRPDELRRLASVLRACLGEG